MTVRKILSSRHTVAKVTRWLRAADELLDAAFKARDGDRLSQGLAVASAVGSVLDALVPERPAHDQLLDMGYKLVDLGLGKFFCGKLQASELKRDQLQVNATTSIVIWAQGSVAAIYRNDEYEAGPYTRGGDRGVLVDPLQAVAWKQGSDLMLDTSDRERKQSYALQPLGEPGVFYGVPGVDWFVNRLQRHEGQTRSMLLIGPTGVGKSTLGRLIARQVDGGRLIKVGARVMRSSSVGDIVEIAEFMQPDVLLLDDVSLIMDRPDYHSRGDGSTRMLELMEALHGKARLVIATLMLEPNRGGAVMRYRRSGADKDNYFDGMRPGRVDEVVRVKRPSPAIRKQILTHYLGGDEGLAECKVSQRIMLEMVKRTEGLTGAYLREVAHRIKVHGVKTYKGEIESVKQAAPQCRGQARRNARGVRVRRRGAKRRKTVWEKRYEEAQLKIAALEAKNEALSLKAKARKK